MTIIYTPDALRRQTEAATDGKVTVLYDSKGLPSFMHILNKFNMQDIDPLLGTGVHPAFMVNGVEKDKIFIGQFQASLQRGVAVSMPGVAPAVSINYDNAKAACVNKGTGWHMMSNWEWAAIMLRSLKDGFEPRGNTVYGRHHRHTFERGVRVDGGVVGSVSGNGNTLTGSGPASWRHDNSLDGICDLVGNVFEWIDGLKIVEGHIHMPTDNHYRLAEVSWVGSGCFFDATGSTTAGNPRLNSSRVIQSTDSSTLNPWSAMTRASGYTPPVAMAQACIDPVGVAKSALGYIYVCNHGERVPIRGGSRGSASFGGFGALTLHSVRSSTLVDVGFRPVFIA
jgi:hypothetical protein